jgi:hypothetical protein
MAQVVKHLPSKAKVLSSIPTYTHTHTQWKDKSQDGKNINHTSVRVWYLEYIKDL